MTLTDFLLARIAEDETDFPAMMVDKRRVLAECEAKRRIVGRHEQAHEDGGSQAWMIEDVLRDLAAVYADHPDYRQEWKP